MLSTPRPAAPPRLAGPRLVTTWHWAIRRSGVSTRTIASWNRSPAASNRRARAPKRPIQAWSTVGSTLAAPPAGTTAGASASAAAPVRLPRLEGRPAVQRLDHPWTVDRSAGGRPPSRTWIASRRRPSPPPARTPTRTSSVTSRQAETMLPEGRAAGGPFPPRGYVVPLHARFRLRARPGLCRQPATARSKGHPAGVTPPSSRVRRSPHRQVPLRRALTDAGRRGQERAHFAGREPSRGKSDAPKESSSAPAGSPAGPAGAANRRAKPRPRKVRAAPRQVAVPLRPAPRR
jgi:hypothetical protein